MIRIEEKDKLTKAVEEVLEFMKHIGLSQMEATVVSQYVHETLTYNSIKESIKEDIKEEILAELEKLKG